MICMKMKMRPASEKRNNGLRDKVYQRSRIFVSSRFVYNFCGFRGGSVGFKVNNRR